MNLDELHSMKYADLLKLAKQELNVTKRLSKEKLLTMLASHLALLSCAEFVSEDDNEEEAPAETTRRGRKRGGDKKEENNSATAPAKKKNKKGSKEMKLDSTFDKETEEPKKADNNEETKDVLNSTFEVEKPASGSKRRRKETAEQIISEDIPASPALKNSPIPAPSDVKSPLVVSNKAVTRRTPSQLTGARPPADAVEPSTPQQPASARKIQFAGQLTGGVGSVAKKTGKGPRAAPNFAEIHQKNFDKMQSVDEYVEKRQRAKTNTTLTGGSKTPAKPAQNPAVSSKTPASTLTKTPASRQSDIKFNFVSGLPKPVFTARGLVATEKKRPIATVKENLMLAAQQQPLSSSMIPIKKMKRATSVGSLKAELNASKVSVSSQQQQVLKGVRVNRRFQLQMQHRNMK